MSKQKINTILVVEDCESEHIIAQVAIRRYDANINVLKAYDGGEALRVIAASLVQPDLILLDINMPGMDGHEFLAEYAKQPAMVTTVAMLTSSDESLDKQQCQGYPFVKDYVVKPIDKGDLERIAALLPEKN